MSYANWKLRNSSRLMNRFVRFICKEVLLMKKVKKDITWLDSVIIGLLEQTVGQIWDSCNNGLLHYKWNEMRWPRSHRTTIHAVQILVIQFRKLKNPYLLFYRCFNGMKEASSYCKETCLNVRRQKTTTSNDFSNHLWCVGKDWVPEKMALVVSRPIF